MAEDSGYMLEPLREEADFTLYRGRELGNPMPILALAVAAEQPVNGDQNPTPDGGVDQKCETIPVLQNCSVLVVDGIDGRYRVRRKEPEGRVQTHPIRLVSGRGDAGVWMR